MLCAKIFILYKSGEFMMINNFVNHLKYIVISILFFQISITSASKITIGQGSSVQLGTSDLISDTLEISNLGELLWGSGNHQILDFFNLNTGISSAQSSTISLSQDWHNEGSFNAGTGSVHFIDLQPLSRITGITDFYELIATTATDKTLEFPELIKQTIESNLVFTGSPGNLLKIISSSSTKQAFLGLDFNASQTIDYVSVTNNHSVLQVIAPGPADSYNSIQGTNARGWFGTPLAFAIPTLNQFSILLLLLITLLMTNKYIKSNIKQAIPGGKI